MADTLQDEASIETESVDAGVGNGHKRKIVMLLLPILLVIGAVVGVYFSGVADSFFSVSEKPDAADSPEAADEPKTEKTGVAFYDVPEILVNLSARPGQQPVYFKIKIALELTSPEDTPKVERLLPRIIDSMQFYLREMRMEELQGSMGTYRLKEELIERMNKILAPVKIKDVLFKDILIQ